MFNPYNLQQATYPLGYNPWAQQLRAAAHAQAQAQLQQSYNQPTLIQRHHAAAIQAQLLQNAAINAASAQHNANYPHNTQLTATATQQQLLQLRNYNQRLNTKQYQSYQHQHQHQRQAHFSHNNNNNSHSSHNNNNNKYKKKKFNKKNIDPSFPRTCTICNIVCNSQQQWDMHVAGKKHTKAIRQPSISSTSTTTTNGQIVSLDNINKNGSISLLSDQYVVEIDGRRKCALCHVEFTSAMCEMSHIQGKRHKMALRGHPIHHNSRKRKAPSVSLGRCDICDVDFTSESQKNSHIDGKKHVKNVRLIDHGQPPKKRAKTNYFSSLQKNNNKTNILPISMQYNNNNKLLKPHEILQKRVEVVYQQYTKIAQMNNPQEAQKLYTEYQSIYEQYIKEYNRFAQNFKKQQIRRKLNGNNMNNMNNINQINKLNVNNVNNINTLNVKKEIKKENNIIKKEETNNNNNNNDNNIDDDDDLTHIPKTRKPNDIIPTITTISSVPKTEKQDDDDLTHIPKTRKPNDIIPTITTISSVPKTEKQDDDEDDDIY